MSAAFPIAMLVVVGAIWAGAAFVNRRLLALLLSHVGDDADVPPVLREPERHPEKLVYFFWRLRQVLAVLLVVGCVAPFVGFAVLFLVALVRMPV